MKTYQAADIRNFAIVGHASCGKTLLGEAMLVCGGAIHRLGSITGGTTVSDYHASEVERQISVHASLLHTEWMDRKFNIIDTPGYQDFISESLGALRVGDFALVVIHAVHGLGVGTDLVWEHASRCGIPRMIVINAVDKETADIDTVLAQARQRYGARVFPMSLPVNPGPGFNRVLDVLRSEVLTYAADGGGKFQEEPAAGEWAEKVRQLHKELIELIAESDDTLLAKFFDQGGLSEEELRAHIHEAVQNQSLIPLFCASAETNVGIARLMDFIAKYGSSPVDRREVAALDADGKPVSVALSDPHPVLYVFKTMSEAQFGELSFFRLYSGSVRSGVDLLNSDRSVTERLGQLYLLNGRARTAVAELGAGDIGAAVKLRDTHTGNTLCSPRRAVTLPKVEYPKPNIHAALRVKAKGEEDKVAAALATLHEEDPTFLFRVDPGLHQTVISAQGELHLEVVAGRLSRRFKVDIELAEPRVAFRETIKAPAGAKYRHKKQSGGAGQFAEVWMRIEPSGRDSGVEFTHSLSGQNVDRGFVPSVEKGVRTACREGILAGYPVVDVRVDFYDGKMHPVDSKDIAFQIAGYFAFKQAFQDAKPCLLEPLHDVEVKIPDDCMGRVMGDLSSRRGRILGVNADGGFQVIRAQVPARELYHYSSSLRSLTGGRGILTEDFSHYEEMPHDLQQRVIDEAAERKKNAR